MGVFKMRESSIYSKFLRYISSSPVFIKHYYFLKRSQSWDYDKLKEYQFKMLKNLITFCYKYIPFYQIRWSEYGIDINGIKDFKDFTKLPFTTKQDVIENYKMMVPYIFNLDKLLLASTGGTTQSKAFFYKTKDSISKEYAFFTRYWKWHEYNPFIDDCVIFKGSWNRPKNQITKYHKLHYFSSFDITDRILHQYVEYIYKNKIKFMQAYPSFAYLLFRYAYEEQMIEKLSHMKAIFCASEKLYEFQKKFIEDNFGVKVYSHYGHGEMGALFQQCRYNDAYHIILEYGYVEFLPIDDTDLYEIVTTGFNNLATPLIRYRTLDYVRLNENLKCHCGLAYPKIVEDIEGRSGDMIVTPSGKIIGPSHLEFFLKGEMTSFWDIQFIQDSLNHITILIVPSNTYREEDIDTLRERVYWRLGEKINIDINIVEKIERPVNQKKRLVVSKLSEV